MSFCHSVSVQRRPGINNNNLFSNLLETPDIFEKRGANYPCAADPRKDP